MIERPEGLNYVLVNGRVWYRTYIPDVGERWTRYNQGRQTGDPCRWEKLLSRGTVFPLTVGEALNFED